MPILWALSGLITPSLEEMAFVAKQMETRGCKLPLLIGGATTSQLHTAVKIAPHYSGATVHVQDASRVVQVLNQLGASGPVATQYVTELKDLQTKMRDNFARGQKAIKFLSLEDCRRRRFKARAGDVGIPSRVGVFNLTPTVDEILSHIDWSPFFWTWELKGKYPAILDHARYGTQARQLFAEARTLMEQGFNDGWIRPTVRLGILPAFSRDESVFVETPGGLHQVPFLRRQIASVAPTEKQYALADWIAPEGEGECQDHLGVFVVSSGFECAAKAHEFTERNDDYNAILVKAIGDRVAEALAEWAHLKFRLYMGSHEDFNLEELLSENYQGIRPAPGYPSCPDHKLKEDIWTLLGPEDEIGARLTENLSMEPAGTVAGFMFFHPEAKYFQLQQIASDQLAALAAIRGLTPEEMKRWIAFQG